jgi:hypothetical protein
MDQQDPQVFRKRVRSGVQVGHVRASCEGEVLGGFTRSAGAALPVPVPTARLEPMQPSARGPDYTMVSAES